ncbi:hypothetical protein SAMN05428978_101152 [Nitrosomonas sp. Nm34]|nr:hypothetical protein SAMN05428978_101152 [Nitrosomonas sp. Nm34]
MLVLNCPAFRGRIPDPTIRCLLQQRFSEVCAGEPYDHNLHGT